MEKILLLNPPGDQPYIRDYFCSKISKSGYLYHPTDLLILSGTLAARFEVRVIDAIVENLSPEDCQARIAAFVPDYLVFLTGSVFFSKDMAFIQAARAANLSLQRVVGIGDVFFGEYREKLLRYEFLDAVLFDFTTDDLVGYLTGGAFSNIPHKRDGEVVGDWIKPKNGVFAYPVPRYELFLNNAYNYPFAREKPFAVVLTNFGCPYKCEFCIMPALGFKTREVDNILEELRYLKRNGFKNIYFNDQTFGANKKQTRELLRAMVEQNLVFGFVCFSRVDLIDEEFVRLLIAAGCHTIMFGVETSDLNLLERYRKGATPDLVRRAVTLCNQQGIRTLGTFILGLPGETRETALRTIEFAKSLPLDYAAFNIAVPRMGTTLREQAISEKLVDANVEEMDQSGSAALIRSQTLGLDEIETLKRRAYREFYFRPSKILGKLLDIKTRVDLENHIRNGWGVLKGLFEGKAC